MDTLLADESIVAVISGSTSTHCKEVSQRLNATRPELPYISWACTATSLSDTLEYPNFYRVVPPDSVQKLVFIDMAGQFKW